MAEAASGGTGIAGVVLAGGRSSRMGGGDKTLLDLGGRPLLARIVGRLSPQVDRLALNANGDPARFAAFGLPVLPDRIEGFPGPLAGMLAAMEWARQTGFASVATVAGDTPFFPADLVARLDRARRDAGAPAAVASSAGRIHPVFGLFDVALADDLDRHLRAGGARAVDWLGRIVALDVAFGEAGASGPRYDPFFNVNTPADLDRARTILENAAP